MICNIHIQDFKIEYYLSLKSFHETILIFLIWKFQKVLIPLLFIRFLVKVFFLNFARLCMCLCALNFVETTLNDIRCHFCPIYFLFTIINSLCIIIVLHWNISYHNCLSNKFWYSLKYQISLPIIILWIEIVPDILQKNVFNNSVNYEEFSSKIQHS